jgi:hypothetical protein
MYKNIKDLPLYPGGMVKGNWGFAVEYEYQYGNTGEVSLRETAGPVRFNLS